MINNIVYLHGFASSPTSNKANHIINFFKNKEIKVIIPDLNCGDFSNVTISKMLNETEAVISEISGKFIIVGSSLGGYIAALHAEKAKIKPEKMLLLAPGFNLYELFKNWLGDFGISEWEKKGVFYFMHYSYKKELPLSYEFYKDLKNHVPFPKIGEIPTYIIHGLDDNVVPLSTTKRFIALNPHTIAEFVEDTHELSSSINLILKRIEEMIYE
ncbi:MAG: alpha/beta fold hydrolase [Deltaproteobacteria bacterium]|nr:alpha/beta fold hydrolase [Deltaproteobacteria bacterium]